MSKLVAGLLGVAVFAAGLQIPSAAQAATIIGGSSLLTPSYLTQLEDWVINDPTLAYDGSLVLTNVFTKGVTGVTAQQFHAAVDGKGPTIFIARALQLNSNGLGGFVAGATMLIGGYNPQSWSSSAAYNVTSGGADRTAFIFNLTTGERRDQTAAAGGEYQTLNTASYGPTFGAGHDVYIDAALMEGYVHTQSYCPPALLATGCAGLPDLMGKTLVEGLDLRYLAFEVFTVAAVPVPAALPMLAAGLGALGLLGWRKRGRAKFATA